MVQCPSLSWYVMLCHSASKEIYIFFGAFLTKGQFIFYKLTYDACGMNIANLLV